MFANAALLLALCCGPAEAATESTSGFASSDNFVVYAPTQELADEVLKKSEQLRTKLARAWLDKELAPGVGVAMIYVSLSLTEDTGFTWPKDDPAKKYHSVTLKSSRDKVVGVTLAHELTHVILATEFGGRLPRWADEGIACFQNDQELRNSLRESLRGLSRAERWPSLEAVLRRPGNTPDNQEFYAVALSLTQYLLELDEPSVFFQFALEGKDQGWEHAAQRHYKFRSLEDLQQRWQSWAVKSLRLAERRAASPIGIGSARSSPAPAP